MTYISTSVRAPPAADRAAEPVAERARPKPAVPQRASHSRTAPMSPLTPRVPADARRGPLASLTALARARETERTALVERGETFVAAFRGGSMRVTQALINDPTVAFNPTDVGSGRIRQADAVDAALRLNTALWTVQRDLRANRVSPSDFKRDNWRDVTPHDLYALAVRRLSEPNRDWRAEANAMVGDRMLDPLRVHMPGETERLTLTHDAINTWGWFMDKSPLTNLLPNRAATIVANMAPMTAVRDGAGTVATAPNVVSRLQAISAMTLRTAEVLSAGSDDLGGRRPLAGNSTILTESLATATQTFQRMEELPSGGLTPRAIENTEQLGREIERRRRNGELNWLDPRTRARVEQLAANGAEEVRRRESSEASERWWRELAGAAVETAGLTVATAGIGTVAALGTRAVTGSTKLARLAYLGTQSLSFTGLNQAAHGHFDALQYPIDLATFGVLSRTGAIASRLAGVGLTGTRTRQLTAQLAAFGITNVSASALTTGTSALVDAWRHGGRLDWQARLEQFGVSLATGAVIHGTNQLISRTLPRLSVEGIHLRERERILREVSEQNTRLPDILRRFETTESEAAAMRARGIQPHDERMQALTRRAGAIMDEHLRLQHDSHATREAALQYMLHHAPQELPAFQSAIEAQGRFPGMVLADGPHAIPTPERRTVVNREVEARDVTRLLEVGLEQPLVGALRSDRSELHLRHARLRAAHQALRERSEWDPVARRRLEHFRDFARRLAAIRENQSETVTESDRARHNVQRMEEMVGDWLQHDTGTVGPFELHMRLRQLNNVATDRLNTHGLRIGTMGEIRRIGIEVSALHNPYLAGARVPDAVERFSSWYAKAERDVHAGRMTPVELAARSYQTLVSIHPFLDGNGRTTRVFMNWVLRRHGLPPATLVGHERNIAHFAGPRNEQAPHVTPDEAVAFVSRGVNRTLAGLESAMYGPLPRGAYTATPTEH